MMFMYPFIMPFLSMFGGYGGFGGFGGNGAGNLLGTGFLSNQINNNSDKETILNALQYNREAISQLAQQTGNSISDVRSAIDIANSKLGEIGAQVGMSGLQVINAVQQGNMSLAQQLCECCSRSQLEAANNTAAIQSAIAAHDSNVRLQLSQNEAADQLAVCRQTNELSTQAANNTNSILGAIKDQNAMLVDQFCQIKEREFQNKLDAQNETITQLRGQISNDKQTEAFNAAFNSLTDRLTRIESRQPNTVPVVYPNIQAVNNTPNFGQNYFPGGFNPWGYGFGGTSYWG